MFFFSFSIEQEEEDDSDEGESSDQKNKTKEKVDAVRSKLLSKLKNSKDVVAEEERQDVVHASDSDSDEYTNELEKERRIKKQKKV